MDTTIARWKVILNFACIYLVWGSTYLAIKYAIAGFPPFFMASVRFVFASLILYVMSRGRKEKSLNKTDFKIAALSGTLLVLANALVCLAETDLSSGLVAIVCGTLPISITLLNWQFFNKVKPQLRQIFGIFLSLAGIFFLTRSQAVAGQNGSLICWLALITATICWAFGTLIQRNSLEKNSLFRFSSVQMSVGAVVMMVIWSIFEGPGSFKPEAVTLSAVLALVYLIIFGSVAAFTSYLWLNRYGEPTIVSTYALVNPVVAIWLGWLFMNEPVTLTTILFTLLVILGIYFVVMKKKPKAKAPTPAPVAE